MIEKEAIRFIPYLKSVIWGGEKICKYKGIPQMEANIGESWEISAVPGHESVVAEGPYKGMKITELIECFGPELLGTDVFDRYDGKFPLLIKIIDAQDNLSVQVHPDDDLAKARHDSLGKTEMWYIIDADKGAKIYSGLKRQLTPEEYVKMVEDNTIEDALAVHDSQAGDVFFLPAGRVHAIGAGNLLAEIQESSDITYRIYDYDRRDAQGNARELHTELAKDAIDYTFHEEYKSAPADPTVADAVIAECGHFKVDRVLVDGEMDLAFDESSFTVVMCLDGEVRLEPSVGTLRGREAESAERMGESQQSSEGGITLRAGETVLVPAAMTCFTIKGKATLLTARSGVFKD